MAKKKGAFLKPVQYPDAEPPRSSIKQIDSERDSRGGLNQSASIYATARRSAQHMSSAKPKGPTWGPSAQQSRNHLASDAPPEPTGPFVKGKAKK